MKAGIVFRTFKGTLHFGGSHPPRNVLGSENGSASKRLRLTQLCDIHGTFRCSPRAVVVMFDKVCLSQAMRKSKSNQRPVSLPP